MLTITDISKIEIYKVKYWCLYFRYDGVHYMIRHCDDCGDHWNELTNKETWETTYSGCTLFDIDDFIKMKYGNRFFRWLGTPYKHIDLEHFVKGLVELKLAKYEEGR